VSHSQLLRSSVLRFLQNCILITSPLSLCVHVIREGTTSQEAGRRVQAISRHNILTACDLNSAFAALFAATAQAFIKPETTATLAYLGQLMLQTQRLAKQEFLEAFDERWPKVVQEAQSFAQPRPSAPDSSDSIAPADSCPESQDDPAAQNDSATTGPDASHKLKIM
jgi:hypothetical protein